ncbi:hypothetical protein A2690_01585 [Candidatus Roizmanbacteria bacterium RIFCSPHIGHO2_01_FULL_39_12b]|uniref:Heat-inducible transcription repressor HrcA C-terminal domain-containing protein n=1 Tax=Candidatus Roizmanbacteria bacterium RIFCSPHIGHO2_01_FULL_39_12b TaxID=1802030 RepID=A0A1F7GB19_9BACT|nr:MAG: hypothetical protein A2690_01585 [Candidatus Roizmanbacteria bacterium RIFCSPHIGHO2_01_FULL_39_12b]OGK46114.1 MAG: hypothetical protein A3B46_02830 [Candidatus Roizmanbacteria bacterium RIFCSPLOWO2_01_FULL_39_19]
MNDLTPRQIDLLKVIISEYTEVGKPVGSELLDKKHRLGVSPATIRNEMVELTNKDYLKKSYFSAGRVPTSKAFRFYIKNLMKEKELSTAEEVAYKSDIWDYRNTINQLLQNATRSLARRTRLLAVCSTNIGDTYYYGVNYVLENPEFWDIDRTRGLFERFETYSFWEQLLKEFEIIEDEIMFMFADEKDADDELASVFGEFQQGETKGLIGVMGPKRMHYETIVPNVRYFTNLIEDILKG